MKKCIHKIDKDCDIFQDPYEMCYYENHPQCRKYKACRELNELKKVPY